MFVPQRSLYYGGRDLVSSFQNVFFKMICHFFVRTLSDEKWHAMSFSIIVIYFLSDWKEMVKPPEAAVL